MTLTPKETESLRISIAEECGWKWHYGDASIEAKTKGYAYWNKGGFNHLTSLSSAGLPPYTTSLDAIQKAAMEKFKTKAERNDFAFCLGDSVTGTGVNIWQLSALDWCIAFARTAKIWRWKV